MRQRLAWAITVPLAAAAAAGAAATLLASTGCIGVQLGSKGGDGGASSSSAAASTSSDGGAEAGAQGIDCIVEATTGATLCTGITSCPGLYVDHDLYPHCGFRPKGNVLDLECACGGDVCPIGVPSTCAQAAQLLEAQSGESQVCVQVAEGRCTPGAPVAGSGGSTAGSACDRACASECGGDPTCIKQCGC